ncbi:MAG: UDP-3-O-(3-hydroxymyristoyl)glucosamine N-acyltransferase [Gammaproteobacteria bacterium]|nr:UDP-3-O-(3-hydroxymyristoyl)glucosamine N-acyltransferase [Gammaproteobacteria bacterium]
MKLAEIASLLGLELQGEGSGDISGIAGLAEAGPGQLTFLFNTAYKPYLKETRASAVILKKSDAAGIAINCLFSDNPRMEWARVASLFDPLPPPSGIVHAQSIIDASARMADNVSVGPFCVIESGATIGKGVVLGPGCYIGRNVSIGENTRVHANVSIYHEVSIGRDCIIHSGTVIGSDGFGFEFDSQSASLKKIPQIYSVVVGDEVELGANVTIDRGALKDTLVGKGVKLDNQVHIGHGVSVGDHTAISGNTAIGGSTRIGNYCLIGGGVGIIDNIEVVDRTEITSLTFVSRPITEPGRYTSGTGLMKNSDWKRNIVGFAKLSELIKRVRTLEKVNKP